MRTAQEIYDTYKILPSLQLHQLRVAAVAKIIGENCTRAIDAQSVILACLFHDMGNIIKSDLTYFPEFVQPEGLAYWEKVRSEFIAKYGTKHHEANVAIARELGLPAASIALIDGIGFSRIAEVVRDPSPERRIIQYADLRVGPHGILPLEDRLAEGRRRYTETRTERPYYEADEEFRRLSEAAQELERQVFAEARVKPEDINDAAIAPLVDELRDYRVA